MPFVKADFPAEIERRIGHRAAVLMHFQAHPNRWIDYHELMKIGGTAAWRTRISEARRIVKLEGGDILNRVQRTGSQVLSQYMYLKQAPLGRTAEQFAMQTSLF